MAEATNGCTGHHFLVVVFPGQGHINPSLQLSRKLTALRARVTFSSPASDHRRMFPNAADAPVDDKHDPNLSFHPYDDGTDPTEASGKPLDLSRLAELGSRSILDLARSQATAGHPISCLIYGILSPWAAAVARELSVPAVAFWIQPATVFGIYHHYFHGYKDTINSLLNDVVEHERSITLPGLPPLRSRDIPTNLLPGSKFSAVILPVFESLFRNLDEEDQQKAPVLVNSFDTLENDALAAMQPLKLVPVGPLVPAVLLGDDVGASADVGDLVKETSGEYLQWLDQQQPRSVVYVCFGSYSVGDKRQVEELVAGLGDSNRPYLWIMRDKEMAAGVRKANKGKGMVVEWCSQEKVLGHKSIGCFVTHCGWNSTLEGLAGGVPIVGMPQWTDQLTISMMVEQVWGVGVRASASEDGVVERDQVRRCLDLVLEDGENGKEIRRRSRMWSDKAAEAAKVGTKALEGFLHALEFTVTP